MIEQIITTSELVKDLLVKHSELRSNDKRLVANVWNIELKAQHGTLNVPVSYFLKEYYITGKVTSPDTITRARRKVQETYPELKSHITPLRDALEKEVRHNITDVSLSNLNTLE